ncbi:hypothetical protein ARMGADRAFT_1075153 [Armillaria gallica]|uniref:Uncharacterized protein n=1 Tax=Armillaria gallica TaxID=47427 RepID=A0A2H3EFX3_ARMGA|nr:hypothetical protein ARMGADRAFT_1075153 [Armillaria gallica]
MSETNPDQDWAVQALQNQNQPPSPPAMHAGNTTGHNPFRRQDTWHPDYPALGQWIREAITALHQISQSQSIDNATPNDVLPDAPVE